jgi:hypothetical protein
MPKPVTPTTPQQAQALKDKYARRPTPAEKAASRGKLMAKGVDAAMARRLVGEDEDVTRDELVRRRIEWCRGLKRTIPKPDRRPRT